MANAVFITRKDSIYDDLPEQRYHFPQNYLNQAKETVGDWIIYYEPRRGRGRQSYFAMARVGNIVRDMQSVDHYYAMIMDYIEFPVPVPYRIDNYFFEKGLKGTSGGVNLGLFQRSIHLIDSQDFIKIVQYGMSYSFKTFDNLEFQGSSLRLVAENGPSYGRETIETVINRKIRDAAFQKTIRNIYDSTCAFTGLRLVNGGGNCEIEAAHIRPVASDGPDSPRNGLALSRTCHWMFDRGLLSLEDDGRILTVPKLIPDSITRMLNPGGFIRMPINGSFRPHPQFLEYHRDCIFKG